MDAARSELIAVLLLASGVVAAVVVVWLTLFAAGLTWVPANLLVTGLIAVVFCGWATLCAVAVGGELLRMLNERLTRRS